MPSNPNAEQSPEKDGWKSQISGVIGLRQIHEELRAEVLKRWGRHVPFADEVFDRWEEASFLGFGEGSSIYNSTLVLGDVSVGENTWVGPFTVIDGRGGLEIGDWCNISSGVQIYSHDTLKETLSGGKLPEERSPTRIGNCCYIAPMSIVSRGVTIGDHSVVGANSFVNKDIPAYSICAGTPAKIIGRVVVDDGHVELFYDVDGKDGVDVTMDS